jgi:transmembrane sensor
VSPRPIPFRDADAWALLPRYFAGDCTPAERAALEAWIAADPAHRAEVDLLRAGWSTVPELEGSDRADALWARIQRGSAEQEGARAPLGADRLVRGTRLWSRQVERGLVRPAMALAASVLIVLGIGLIVRAGRRRSEVAGGGREYVTAGGQRLTVTLVDGTRVMLAPESRVRISGDYARPGGTRDVALDGEGYFTVVHDPAHPFAVHAADAVVTDVGTRFDVRAYGTEGALRVAVTEGSVALRSARDAERVLRGSDVATAGRTGTTIAHGADVASLTAWTTGTLVFTDTPLGDAVRELARWYGAEIALDDPSLAARHITVTVTETTPDAALALIAPAVGAHATHVGRRFTITPDSPQQP